MSQQALVQPQRRVQSSTPTASGVLQRKCYACRKKKPLMRRQARCSTPESVPPIVHEVLRSPGEPDAAIQASTEPRFSHDFSQIPVHSRSLANVQAKLSVGSPGDVFEQEADRIANQVIAAPAHTTVSNAPLHIQRFSGQSNGQKDEATASVDQVLASPGKPLESVLRQDMEQRFGYDFSQVRVHSGRAAEQSARDVSARAYTVGQNIVFGANQFAPGSSEGQRLLAHELTHVIQQGGAATASFPIQSLIQEIPVYLSERHRLPLIHQWINPE